MRLRIKAAVLRVFFLLLLTGNELVVNLNVLGFIRDLVLSCCPFSQLAWESLKFPWGGAWGRGRLGYTPHGKHTAAAAAAAAAASVLALHQSLYHSAKTTSMRQTTKELLLKCQRGWVLLYSSFFYCVNNLFLLVSSTKPENSEHCRYDQITPAGWHSSFQHWNTSWNVCSQLAKIILHAQKLYKLHLVSCSHGRFEKVHHGRLWLYIHKSGSRFHSSLYWLLQQSFCCVCVWNNSSNCWLSKGT